MVRLTTALSLSLLAALVSSQTTTIFPNDTRIRYSAGDWDEVDICKYGEDGKLIGGQTSCYNLGAEPCVESVRVATKDGANLTLKFKGLHAPSMSKCIVIKLNSLNGGAGTGITFNSLSQGRGGPSIVTITLDGKDSSYTSDPVHAKLVCEAVQSGAIDKDKEHTLTVTLRPASDAGPEPPEDTRPFLFFTGFTITTAEDRADNSTTSDAEPSSTPPSSTVSLTRPGVVTAFRAALFVPAVAYLFRCI